MSINKTDIMRNINNDIINIYYIVDKSKLVILRVDKLFFVIPLTMTKIEVKLRNVIINEKPKFDGLARFMQFYL